MDLGYFAMPLHAPGTPLIDAFEHDLMQLEYLDGLGFTEAWIGEHFTFPWEPIACPDLLITAALQRTKNIRLGTGVACLPSHHPLQLATRYSQLDHISRGRLNFGVGASGFNESELWGLDWTKDEHRKKFHEVLDTVIGLWTDPAPGVYESEFFKFKIPVPEEPYRVEYHFRPFQSPHPPIAIAAMRPNSESLVMAGERGFIPMSINFAPILALKASWNTYETAAIGVGRTADRSMWRIARDVFVGKTKKEAREQVLHGSLGKAWREHVLLAIPRLQVPWEVLLGENSGVDPADTDGLLDWLCENLWIVGDVDEVTDKLNTLYDEVGGFGTLLAMQHHWDRAGAWQESFRLLSEEVQPRLRSIDAVVAGV